MIIFGYRRRVRNLGFTTLVCQHCRNPVAQALRKSSSWFTLFFIPVFPYRIVRFLQCTFCGFTPRISKEQEAELLPYLQDPNTLYAGAPPGYQGAPAHQLPPAPYQQRPYHRPPGSFG